MDTTQPLDFGSYVKSTRKKCGYSVRHLATLTGVAPSTITRIEHNTLTAPGPDLVLALIKELDLDSGIAIRLLEPYQRLLLAILPNLTDYLSMRCDITRKEGTELQCHVRRLGYDPNKLRRS